MPRVEDIADLVRSKNAGPFWLTVDVFCPDATTFDQLRATLTNAKVAAAFNCPTQQLRRFEIETLHVLKFSLPRPEVQGSPADRDMHGASFATLIAEINV